MSWQMHQRCMPWGLQGKRGGTLGKGRHGIELTLHVGEVERPTGRGGGSQEDEGRYGVRMFEWWRSRQERNFCAMWLMTVALQQIMTLRWRGVLTHTVRPITARETFAESISISLKL